MSQQAQRSTIQILADLKDREAKARNGETRLRTQLESVQEELKKVSQKAKDLYGTDDVAKIREQFQNDKASDEQALRDYQTSITVLEDIVSTVNEAVEAQRSVA